MSDDKSISDDENSSPKDVPPTRMTQTEPPLILTTSVKKEADLDVLKDKGREK